MLFTAIVLLMTPAAMDAKRAALAAEVAALQRQADRQNAALTERFKAHSDYDNCVIFSVVWLNHEGPNERAEALAGVASTYCIDQEGALRRAADNQIRIMGTGSLDQYMSDWTKATRDRGTSCILAIRRKSAKAPLELPECIML